MTQRATVELVGHGEAHPYAIAVTTPGWRGVDAAFEGRINLPEDLQQIQAVLKRAKLKPWRMLFMADGAAEFILEDSTDFKRAVRALVRARWLAPAGNEEVLTAFRDWRDQFQGGTFRGAPLVGDEHIEKEIAAVREFAAFVEPKLLAASTIADVNAFRRQIPRGARSSFRGIELFRIFRADVLKARA